MAGFGILMIVFGLIIVLSGLYLVICNKKDFASVLLWKSNVNKMSVREVQYAGKVTMTVGLAPIISGIVALLLKEESIIPVILLIFLIVLFLIISIKIFK